MSTVKEIYDWIDSIAPFAAAGSWDNSGLLVETGEPEIDRVLLALDITGEVAREAQEIGAQLIVAHHPVIFHPLRSLHPGQPAYWLVRYGINAICAHTNLDVAVGGVNDALAQRLGLRRLEPLEAPGASGLSLGRIGELERPVDAGAYPELVKRALGCGGLKYVPRSGEIRRVAVCGGAGADLIYRARELGADALVTADSKHNLLLDAAAMGLMLIDAGHACTERVVLEPLAERLRAAFPKVECCLSRCAADPAQYI